MSHSPKNAQLKRCDDIPVGAGNIANDSTSPQESFVTKEASVVETISTSPMANGDTLFATMYDSVLEEKEYSRALMSPADLVKLKEDIAKQGFMTIEKVRELVWQNTIKESQEARGETYAIDPEIMMLIDTRINFRVFITGDNVYTREDLFTHYPFEAFCTTPEEVFVQQEIGVFPSKDPRRDNKAHEFIARAVGGNEEFTTIEDLVGCASRKNYKTKRAPIRIVKTKIFLGKDRWEEFATMKRFVQSFQTFVTPLMIASRGGNAPSIHSLTNLFGGQTCAPLAIQDEASLSLEREQQAQEREEQVLESIELKVQALRMKEEELRIREEKLCRSLDIDPLPRSTRSFESYVPNAK